MGYMDETLWSTRRSGYDDETQKFLISFFNEVANEPGFQDMYLALNDAEKTKLHEMNAANPQ